MPPAKKSTTKKAADGPKYSELIKAALLGLKERNGSSLAAIKKYLAANFPAAKNDLALKNALKFGVNKGMFIKVKASFKLSAEGKKKGPAKKKATKKKPGAAKKTKTAKKPGEKKAPGPYMVFCKEKRPEIMKKNPGIAFGEVGKKLGAAWKALSDAEKAKFGATAAKGAAKKPAAKKASGAKKPAAAKKKAPAKKKPAAKKPAAKKATKPKKTIKKAAKKSPKKAAKKPAAKKK